MAYLPPYQLLRNAVAVSPDGQAVLMSRDTLRMLIGALAQVSGFDAAWYRGEYPDIAEAIESGELADELDHFAFCGFEEGRMPGWLPVDEAWYRDVYADVDDALAGATLTSAADHYNGSGYQEGRASSPQDEAIVLRWQDVLAEGTQIVEARVSAMPTKERFVPWGAAASD
jgi:hypothetical protein